MDSRFHLSVTFTIYGAQYEWSPSLNWTAEPGQIDSRITAWFLGCHDEAYDAWQTRFNKAQDDIRRAEIESIERAELKRLRAKYPE